MFSFHHKGSFKNLDRFLLRVLKGDIYAELEMYAQEGVYALQSLTPRDSGLTANSWDYEIDRGGGNYPISWNNTNVNNGVNIAVILQYGHGTGTGGYVAGYDYINPALKPIFDAIAEKVWRAVRNA